MKGIFVGIILAYVFLGQFALAEDMANSAITGTWRVDDAAGIVPAGYTMYLDLVDSTPLVGTWWAENSTNSSEVFEEGAIVGSRIDNNVTLTLVQTTIDTGAYKGTGYRFFNVQATWDGQSEVSGDLKWIEGNPATLSSQVWQPGSGPFRFVRVG